MKNLIYYFSEKDFIKEMRDLTKDIIFLTNSKDELTAYSYKLVFYSKMIGFLEKNKNIDIHDLLIDLNIDDKLMYELYSILYCNNKENKNSDSIIYSYYRGYKLRYVNKKKILDNLFNMHLEIIKNDFVNDNKENNQYIKRKIL